MSMSNIYVCTYIFSLSEVAAPGELLADDLRRTHERIRRRQDILYARIYIPDLKHEAHRGEKEEKKGKRSDVSTRCFRVSDDIFNE